MPERPTDRPGGCHRAPSSSARRRRAGGYGVRQAATLPSHVSCRRRRQAVRTRYAVELATATNSQRTQGLTCGFTGQPTQLDPANAQGTESGLQANSPALAARQFADRLPSAVIVPSGPRRGRADHGPHLLAVRRWPNYLQSSARGPSPRYSLPMITGDTAPDFISVRPHRSGLGHCPRSFPTGRSCCSFSRSRPHRSAQPRLVIFGI